MVLRAHEIMTDRVVAVRADTSIATARERLRQGRFTALPVVDEHNRLVGVVSAADLLGAPAERGGTVGAVMTRDVLAVRPDTDIGIVAHRMRIYGGVRMVPVVDRGFLVGVVTRSDLLRPRSRGGRLGRVARRVLRGVRRTPATGPPVVRPSAAAAALPRVAGDVMTGTGLVTLRETTPAAEAASLLLRNRWTALPVVDADGHLVGIVSEADLVDDPLDGRRSPRPRTVAAAMTTDVVSLPPDAGL